MEKSGWVNSDVEFKFAYGNASLQMLNNKCINWIIMKIKWNKSKSKSSWKLFC